MEKEKALQIIKQTIDQAIGMGLFKNVETVVTVSQALSTVIEQLMPANNISQ